MPNSLDLIIIVFLGLVTLGLLSLCLMFMVKKPVVKKIAFYVAVILGLFICSVGLRIFLGSFPGQSLIAVLMGLTSIAAVVVERIGKNNEKMWKIARIMATVSVVVGTLNSFMI